MGPVRLCWEYSLGSVRLEKHIKDSDTITMVNLTASERYQLFIRFSYSGIPPDTAVFNLFQLHIYHCFTL